jgi:hypothetical protein
VGCQLLTGGGSSRNENFLLILFISVDPVIMEVGESEWKERARSNVTQYLNRGGDGKGDEPEYLGGTSLVNMIGAALSLTPDNPATWTPEQRERAFRGELCFYSGDAKKAIDQIVEKIVDNCGGDSMNYITVLPVELYNEGKLYELPVFRFRRHRASGKWLFVDHVGRVYQSYEDWFDNSQLPPCTMLFPSALCLKREAGRDSALCSVDDTPAARLGAQAARVGDYAALGAGIVGGVGALVFSGGLATPFVIGGIGSALWGTGRTVQQLADRGTHDESVNPFTNSEARLLWLGLLANCISFGAMGASARLGSLAARGKDISSVFKVVVNTLNGTSLAVNLGAIINSTVYMYDNREHISEKDILLQCISVAFWTKSAFSFKTANGIIKMSQDATLKQFTRHMPDDAHERFANMRQDLNDDMQLLRFLDGHARQGRNPAAVASILSEFHSALGEEQNLRLNPDGTIGIGGGDVRIDRLDTVPAGSRPVVFRLIASIAGSTRSEEDLLTLKDIRDHFGSDYRFLEIVARVSRTHGVTPEEAMRGMIGFWNEMRASSARNGHEMPNMRLTDQGGLVVGHGHEFQLNQLRLHTEPDHVLAIHHISSLSPADTAHFTQFRGIVNNDPLLLRWIGRLSGESGRAMASGLVQLSGSGLGRICPFRLLTEGRSMISLNRHLNVSAVNLLSCSSDIRTLIFREVSGLPESCTTAQLRTDYKSVNKTCVVEQRFRFEFMRKEAVDWFGAGLRRAGVVCQYPHEQDRLYTIMTRCHEPQYGSLMRTSDNAIVKFALWMQPQNVSQFASYVEFGLCFLQEEMTGIVQSPEHRNLPKATRGMCNEIFYSCFILCAMEASRKNVI